MTEHALELLHVALWMLGVVGGAMVGIGVWGIMKVIDLFHSQQENLVELREIAHAFDIRLTRVETHCSLVANSSGHSRRATDTNPGGI